MPTDTETLDLASAARNDAAGEEERFISVSEAARIAGVSCALIWRLARRGAFPQPVKISARCTRWRLLDVRAWMEDPQAWKVANQEA